MKPDSPSFTEKQSPNFTVVHTPVVPQKIEKSNPAKKIAVNYTQLYFSSTFLSWGFLSMVSFKSSVGVDISATVARCRPCVIAGADAFSGRYHGEPWLRGW